MIRHALMIGPVMYTLVFLKNWLTIQIASNTAVVVICFVVIFINPPCFAEQNATAFAGAEDFPPLFSEGKCEPAGEQRIFLLCFVQFSQPS